MKPTAFSMQPKEPLVYCFAPPRYGEPDRQTAFRRSAAAMHAYCPNSRRGARRLRARRSPIACACGQAQLRTIVLAFAQRRSGVPPITRKPEPGPT